MASCFRQSSFLSKKLLMCNKVYTLKFYSSLSPVYDKISSSNCNFYYYTNRKLNSTEQVQCRYFSMNRAQTYSDVLSPENEYYKIGKEFLIQAHEYTGMPWWLTIFSAAAAMKLLISLPCGICQQHISSKLELTKGELDATAGSIKSKILVEAQRGKWTQQKFRSEFNSEMRKQWKMLVVKNNCHPFKNIILFIVQFPVWLFMTISIRKLAADVIENRMDNPIAELQFLVGGPSWCSNLATPDPLYILPLINMLSAFAVSEINFLNADLKVGNKKRNFLFSKIIPNLVRILAVVIFFVSSVSPSGMSLFWAVSSIFALFQNLLLLSPKIRKLFRIPMTPNDLPKPYSQIWFAFLQKFTNFLSKK